MKATTKRVAPVARSGAVLALAVATLLTAAAVPVGAQPARQWVRLLDGTIDVSALYSWMDYWFARHLADPQTGAPGGVVAVVEGNRILLVRGYGLADVATRRHFDPDTVVRVGSLSKPATATAVMQLVESGRVDVRRPVSDYVRDVLLPARHGRPVTVHDLLTHSAGFDVRLERTAASSDTLVAPLSEYLRENMPPQVRPAGEALAYSNHGYTLLGRLVEAVSGESFEAYAEAHVFRPLGMASSGFRLTPALAQRSATGYERGDAGFRPALTIHPRIYPAAGLNTTAGDMARFLVAHLNGGSLGGARILSAAAVEEMHRQQFALAPGVPGVAFGFFEYPVRGERALVHGGGIRGFISGIALWPERRLGLFVSNNGYSDWIVRDLIDAFARRYLPAVDRPPERVEGRDQIERYAGSYRPLGATAGSVEKAGALRNDELEVGVNYWRRLTIGRSAFVQVGRGAFVGTYDDEPFWMIERPGSGAILAVTTDPVNGIVGWERLPWYATARCHREILFTCCAVLVSVIGASVRSAWKRRGRSAATPTRRAAGAARALLVILASADLLVLALVFVAFRAGQGAGMLFGLPDLARWALKLNLAAAALSLPVAIGAWPVWLDRTRPRWERVHFTCGVAACLTFAAWSWYWKLLG